MLETSRDGDPEAARIVDWAADEIVAMAGATIRRLGMTKLDVDVVLGGGVLGAKDGRLLGRVDDGIHRVAPEARIGVLDVPPVAGAALIGLDHLAARQSNDGHRALVGKAAAARVRSAITHETMRDGEGDSTQALVGGEG